jgi:hypothetical protein
MGMLPQNLLWPRHLPAGRARIGALGVRYLRARENALPSCRKPAERFRVPLLVAEVLVRAVNAVGRFIHAAKLCFLLVFRPEWLAREEPLEEENQRSELVRRAKIVRRALWRSFLLVVASAVVGGSVGLLMGRVVGCPPAWLINWLQIAGAGIVLWATLFVRGWEIQTFGGETLVEQANQWIYRALQFVGTVVLAGALCWSQCA